MSGEDLTYEQAVNRVNAHLENLKEYPFVADCWIAEDNRPYTDIDKDDEDERPSAVLCDRHYEEHSEKLLKREGYLSFDITQLANNVE